MFALSGTAFALWLTPLTVLDKRIGWHKSLQGLSLFVGVACAAQAANIARQLSAQEEIETIKTRAITADVIDEISTSAYISQQERQQEAEQILNGAPERSDDVGRLERLMALTCEEPERLERSEQISLTKEDSDLLERILQLKARGYGKAKIIFELWGVNKGGSAKYKLAESEYNRLTQE
ncbi:MULTISPECIES: hypothetical protein [unclassified Microcoleus]|uniref:hypothetical protein n=1 Tax=unclassified Microcoleus TaxID=2642155 RepID=UPI002FD606AC